MTVICTSYVCYTVQREVHQLRSSASGQQQHQPQQQQSQQANLVSLDSWSQPSNADSTWDAFSNQPEASSQPVPQGPSGGPQPSPLSPLSPQRQIAAARAQAFIKTQTSNVQSMQVHCLSCQNRCLQPLCGICPENQPTPLLSCFCGVSCFSVDYLGVCSSESSLFKLW